MKKIVTAKNGALRVDRFLLFSNPKVQELIGKAAGMKNIWQKCSPAGDKRA